MLALALAFPAAASVALQWETARVFTAASAEEVAEALGGAGQEVLVATDLLRSRAVADVLRAAMRRGARVLILTGRPGLVDRDGYLLGLLMAGAEVRLGSLTTRAAIVDGKLLISGPHLAGIPAQDAITIVVESPRLAQKARTRFLFAWQKGEAP